MTFESLQGPKTPAGTDELIWQKYTIFCGYLHMPFWKVLYDIFQNDLYKYIALN
jgi:hypothetical protein